MPHIHTKPNQHDMTASAWIVCRVNGEWRCLVHFHKKIEKYMQIGGHLELDETPWQTMVHELKEESGYTPGELRILQHTTTLPADVGNVSHPVPFAMNTHSVGNEHFHSDLCYGFVAEGIATASVAAGESDDFLWATVSEIRQLAMEGRALEDIANTYEFLINGIDTYVQVPAQDFSLEKPIKVNAEYKSGAVER